MTLQSAARGFTSTKFTSVGAVQFGPGFLFVATAMLFVACRGSTEPLRPSLWTSLAAERWFTCGLSPDAQAYCWGGFTGGWRGIPPIADSIAPNSAVPLRVPGGRRFVEITVGETPICALDEGRAAFCWGPNQSGDVGDGSFVAKRGPSPVSGGHGWNTIDAGMSHVCGVAVTGITYCWGNGFRGALGNGALDGESSEPVAVVGGHTFTRVWAGSGKACALTTAHDAYCWGVNDHGVLGDGEPPEIFKESATPIRVVGGHHFAALAVGGYQVCGITLDAQAYCWGWNRYGQLGDGTNTDSSVPVLVGGDLRWASLSSGLFHICGLTTEGVTYCWGSNENGQFGIGVSGTASSPLMIATAGVYVEIVAGGRHSCARTAAGTAHCWGEGQYGQLGDGLFANRLHPVQVAGYE